MVSTAKVVFLFGAGASRDAQVPTMDECREAMDRRARAKRCEPWLARLLERVHAADERNLEVIWSRLDMARASGVPCISADYPDFVRLVAECLVYDSCSLDRCGYSHLLCKLLGHAQLGMARLRDDSIAVLTFNQDVTLDHTLRRIGEKCFGGHAWAGWLRYWIGRPHEEDANYPPKLLKLHGSLNWGICEDPECGSGIAMQDRFEALPDLLYCTPCNYHGQDGSRTLRPLMVPPTWLKSPHGASLRRIWAQAYAELSSAKLLVVIGHSWPASDVYLEHLYALAFRDRAPCDVLVVDPCKTTAECYKFRLERLVPAMKGHVDIVDRRFADSVDGIVTRVAATLGSS